MSAMQGEEWWSIVRIWAGEDPFDYAGTYYRCAAWKDCQSPTAPESADDERRQLTGPGVGSPSATRICISMASTRLRPVSIALRRRSDWRVKVVEPSRYGLPWASSADRPRRTPLTTCKVLSTTPTGARSDIGSRGKRTTRACGPIPRACDGVAGTTIFRLSGGSWREGPAVRSVIRMSSHGALPAAIGRLGRPGPQLRRLSPRAPYFAAEVLPRLERMGCARPPLANQPAL